MAGRIVPCKPEDVMGLLVKDVDRLNRRILKGLVTAAGRGGHAVVPRIPIAFGTMRKSVHVDATEATAGHVRIVVDAPEAASVEQGSRPHVPPLGPILKWVKLRGMQGIDKKGELRSPTRNAWGPTTAAAAHRIASQIRDLEKQTLFTGRHVEISAVLEIARAIQRSIGKHGTKPQWPVRRSLPEIAKILDFEITAAVTGPQEWPGG